MTENQHTEWKEVWRDDYLRWVCAFANAEGGTLVIGRNDRGEVVGLKNAARLLEDLPNKVRDVLGVVVDVNLCTENGREYLEIVVPAYANPISYKGEYCYRSGSTTQTLKGAALDRFFVTQARPSLGRCAGAACGGGRFGCTGVGAISQAGAAKRQACG
jgi:ATP-dependent DNA helicase RecG